MSEQWKLGDLASFSCPECGGTLWEMTEGALLRYRSMSATPTLPWPCSPLKPRKRSSYLIGCFEYIGSGRPWCSAWPRANAHTSRTDLHLSWKPERTERRRFQGTVATVSADAWLHAHRHFLGMDLVDRISSR
jgi:hypothetical protein